MINLLFFLFALWQEEIPLKPKEEFEVKLNYEFKQRSEVNTAATVTIDYREGVKDTKSGGPLPYLTLNLKLIKLPNGELKIKGVSNLDKVVVSKKVTEGEIVKVILGFTDDLKDRVSAHEYNFFLLNGAKKEVNRIHVFVKPDGTFTVNGEVRGKF
jgi:hypothetical protein